MAWITTQKISLSFSFAVSGTHSFSFLSFVSFVLSFAPSFVHSFSFESFSFAFEHSFSFSFLSFPSFQCSIIHVDWTIIPAWHNQMSAIYVAIHNLQCFSERVDTSDIQPQMLLQWTSGLLQYLRNQRVTVQWHSSRLLMSVLQYDEITQITLEMVTPQPKGNDLIQEIRRTSSTGQ